MKGLWNVTSGFVGSLVLYQVYRLLDIGEVDHSENREYAEPVFYDKKDAQEYADYLNRKEALDE